MDKNFIEMQKETFVQIIQAIENQKKKDFEIAEKFSEIFKSAFTANLLPDNSILYDAIIKLLEYMMDDNEKWIDYYIYELDCGKESDHLKAIIDGNEIILSNASELYYFLINNKKRIRSYRKRI